MKKIVQNSTPGFMEQLITARNDVIIISSSIFLLSLRDFSTDGSEGDINHTLPYSPTSTPVHMANTEVFEIPGIAEKNTMKDQKIFQVRAFT